MRHRRGLPEGKRLERRAIGGESPVPGTEARASRESKTGHVKSCPKTRGPPRKAKYGPATDSEQVPLGKGEKHPGRGVKEILKPRADEMAEGVKA